MAHWVSSRIQYKHVYIWDLPLLLLPVLLHEPCPCFPVPVVLPLHIQGQGTASKQAQVRIKKDKRRIFCLMTKWTLTAITHESWSGFGNPFRLSYIMCDCWCCRCLSGPIMAMMGHSVKGWVVWMCIHHMATVVGKLTSQLCTCYH